MPSASAGASAPPEGTSADAWWEEGRQRNILTR